MRIAQIRGCDIKVHPLFVAVMFAAALSGYLRIYLLAFALVLLHEGCHALAARAFGFAAREIELLPFGGVARLDGMFEHNPSAEFVIAAAGPACNLLLMMAAISLDSVLPLPPQWLRLFVDANLGIAALNLLPALPLDGGRMLRGLLARRFDIVRVTRLCSLAGVVCGAGLVAFFLWGALRGVLNISIILMAVFLLLAAFREYRQAPYLLFRTLEGKRRSLGREGALPVRQIVARSDLKMGSLVRRFSPGFYHIVTVLDERCNPLGVLHEEQFLDALLRLGAEAPVGGALPRLPIR